MEVPRERVQAPVDLLGARDLSPTARVLWLALRAVWPAGPRRLSAASGLAKATVHRGLAERQVRPQAKLLWGLLQTLPGFSKGGGEFSYTSLSAATGLSRVTLRRLIGELESAGWVEIYQANQLAPVHFRLRHPEADRRADEVAQAHLRLEQASFTGEAIMKEYLSLLIDSTDYTENARPGFLINPLTDERMELDRYYPPLVGFEYQGAQHDRTTERHPSQEELRHQQARDLMKEALCARQGVKLVQVRPEELSLKAMQAKVGTRLPLRDLSCLNDLVQYLEKVSRKYRRKAAAERGS